MRVYSNGEETEEYTQTIIPTEEKCERERESKPILIYAAGELSASLISRTAGLVKEI